MLLDLPRMHRSYTHRRAGSFSLYYVAACDRDGHATITAVSRTVRCS